MILSVAEVYRPVAQLTILGENTYIVDINGPVGSIEKTHGWQFRDNAGYVKLGIIRVAQEPPSIIMHLASLVVSEQPASEGPATIYRFWKRGSENYFATYFDDLNNLEIKNVESELTAYICIFLVLLTKLSLTFQA